MQLCLPACAAHDRTIQAAHGRANEKNVSETTAWQPAFHPSPVWQVMYLDIDYHCFGAENGRPEDTTMKHMAGRFSLSAVLLGVLLLSSMPAEAFRCGNRIIQDGMHEELVIKFCGKPISKKPLGLVLRSYYPDEYSAGGLRTSYYRYGYLTEVMATEWVYNFGPRKLMRILRFEGGYLANIRTAGYGYIDKDE